jgi:hypothetical protein
LFLANWVLVFWFIFLQELNLVGFFGLGKPNVSFLPIFLDLLLNSDLRNCVFFLLLFNGQSLVFWIQFIDFCLILRFFNFNYLSFNGFSWLPNKLLSLLLKSLF